jgi:ATP-dependent DNA ligase
MRRHCRRSLLPVARPVARQSRAAAVGLPQWIKPQLTQLVDQAPDGPDWPHEIKFDGYRMHARLDRGAVRLLTRTLTVPISESPKTPRKGH